ncbi:MAG TPA: molybdenum ABC transporter ATP-binding protein [Candidatus Deferrimicrobiaceae bacterium]|jgi:molybdate transport system ATP-binding protein
MRLELACRKRLGNFTLDAALSVEGERIGLFGPSGSGKSTLVGALSGLVTPDSGRIVLDGTVLFDREAGIDIPPERRRIAVVFQNAHLFPHLDVRANLLYGYRRCPKAERRIALEPVADALGLSDLLGRSVGNLSGGERQRVALGRALLSNPRLILLDEPLSGLDDALKYRVIPFLRKTFDGFGVPFLFISHALLEMRLMAGQVAVVEAGRIAEMSSAEALAIGRMGVGGAYVNLLRLVNPSRRNGLSVYPWGGTGLVISGEGKPGETVFVLSARDIILIREHPGAISARNLLPCRIERLHDLGTRTGVGLSCGGERLVAEVSRETSEELDLRPGQPIYAAIKASAFRELFGAGLASSGSG